MSAWAPGGQSDFGVAGVLDFKFRQRCQHGVVLLANHNPTGL